MPRTCRLKATPRSATRSTRRRVSGRRAKSRRNRQSKISNRRRTGMAHGNTPVGINHVVLNVRDIEASHKFWTEIVGLKQVGALHPRAEMGATPRMQFYSGDH